jgi:hypothetical protein
VLPGGETLFDDNYVRLGSVNRSLVSQALLCFDDLGYSANTASVFRREPFLANAVLMGDTVRVTGSRFREDANHTISALTQGFRTNITTLNQADHCIVARPARVGASPLPTIDTGNQVLDAIFCDRTFGNAAGLAQFATQSLSANARELGGTLPDNAFTTAEMGSLSRQYAARSMAVANQTQVATTQAYSYEAQRLAVKLGADHPMARALQAQADAGVQTAQLIASSAEVATVQVAAPVEGGSALGGRFVNARGQGQQGYVVGLLRGNGTQLEVVGTTDEAGTFSAVYDPKQTAVLQKEGDLFLRVTDASGKQEIVRGKEPVRLAAGANVQVTLTGPVRIVPKSVALDGTVIFGTRTTPATPAPPAAPPGPTPPATVATPVNTTRTVATSRCRAHAARQARHRRGHPQAARRSGRARRRGRARDRAGEARRCAGRQAAGRHAHRARQAAAGRPAGAGEDGPQARAQEEPLSNPPSERHKEHAMSVFQSASRSGGEPRASARTAGRAQRSARGAIFVPSVTSCACGGSCPRCAAKPEAGERKDGVVHGPAGTANRFDDCPANWKPVANAAQALGASWVGNVVTGLGALPSPLPARVSALLTTHFHTTYDKDIAKILERFRKLNTAIKQSIDFQCESSCDKTCWPTCTRCGATCMCAPTGSARPPTCGPAR